MSVSYELDHVRSLIHGGDVAALASFIRPLDVEPVVDLLKNLPTYEAAVVFRVLSKTVAIEAFEALDTRTAADVVAELGEADVSEAFAGMDPEEQSRLLDEIPAKVARRLLARMEPADRDPLMRLLGYPKGSVGRGMTVAAVRADVAETVAEVLERASATDNEFSEIPVAHQGRHVGTVNVLDLLRHPADTRIGAIVDPHTPTAATTDEAESAARRLLDSGHAVMPVLDHDHRLVGILPISDAAKIDRDAVAEDHARSGASEPLRRPYLLTTVRAIARARFTWLLVLAVSAVLTVQVLELFEATLAQQVALALFIPLVTGIGGNTGSQAATTITRAVALGDVRLGDVFRVVFKEVRVGLLLGVLLASIAFVIASLAYGLDIGSVIAVTLVLNCPIAATVGGAVPLVARACKVDPAVFSTPFITTFCDASGLLVYFTVAISILNL